MVSRWQSVPDFRLFPSMVRNARGGGSVGDGGVCLWTAQRRHKMRVAGVTDCLP